MHCVPRVLLPLTMALVAVALCAVPALAQEGDRPPPGASTLGGAQPGSQAQDEPEDTTRGGSWPPGARSGGNEGQAPSPASGRRDDGTAPNSKSQGADDGPIRGAGGSSAPGDSQGTPDGPSDRLQRDASWTTEPEPRGFGDGTPLPQEEWSPLTLGLEGGPWVDALLNLSFTLGGDAAQAAGLTEVDAEDDLDLGTRTEGSFARLFFDSRFVSLRASYWQVRYTGNTTLAQTINVGDQTFNINSILDSELTLQSGALHIQGNILNDEFLRLGIFVGGRAIRVTTDLVADVNGDGSVIVEDKEQETLPLPQVGLDLVIRLFDMVEIHGRASYVDADSLDREEVEGHYTEVDAGITVYPFGIGGSRHLGLRASYLLHRIQVSANDAEVDDEVSLDLELEGFLFTVVLRF